MVRAWILLLFVALAARTVGADGFIVPEPPSPPLAVKFHRVHVTVDLQAAHTEVDEVFINKALRDIEGTYLFPLPEGASFSAFSMLVDGQPLAAEVLPADDARRLYEEIVRRRLDPALLEYVGRGAYRARIFPLPASGQKRVQMAYDELLSREAGVIRYTYPLNTEKFSADPLEDVSVVVEIHSAEPLKAIYSPSHPIEVQREGEYHARVVWADEGVRPDADFVLYYTVAQDPVGVDLVTYLPPDEDRGYYLLLAAPQYTLEQGQVIPKRMIFVLDRSGSMQGEKMEQARGALNYAIDHLDPGDAIDIVDYATTVSAFADSAVTVDERTRTALKQYVGSLEAMGGTDISDALVEALGMLRGDERLEMVVFLTDGKPTVGELDTEEILEQAAAANICGARVFVFGVGHDVNTHLLDRLSAQSGGYSTYVEPGEDIAAAVSSFYDKVSNPVLEDLHLSVDGIRLADSYPPVLPDLFRGGQLVQLGRFSGSGPVDVTLKGRVRGASAVFERHVDVGPGGADFLPRLWATRKVGFLLDEIRLHGEDPELVDAIVELSKRYGIITPYTSFLILEDELPVPTLANEDLKADSGAGAVAAAEDMRSYTEAENIQAVRSTEVRYVGTRTFFLRDGVWQDSRIDVKAPVREYAFGSDQYFRLLLQYPDLGPCLAVGPEVAVAMHGFTLRVRGPETAVEEDQEKALPARFALEQNYPNPFNSRTQIRFTLTAQGGADLAVFDLSGQRVATLIDGALPAGAHVVNWDGRGNGGRPVASGVYVYRLQVGTLRRSRKLVVLK